MNKTNFNQTGGFPLKTERIQELQSAYEIFNSFGSLAGNLTIVSGCETIGTTVQDGFVFIDGELLAFREGAVAVGSEVIIIEEPANKEFENGTSKVVHYIRYATFGTASTSWLWTDFVRPIQTKLIPTDLVTRLEELEKKSAVFQAGGGMVLWNKPALDIPVGWQEVIDWKGRIPVGLDTSQVEFDTMGKQSGAKNKTLSIAEMPQHGHDWKYTTEGDDSGSGGSFNEFTLKPGSIPISNAANPIGKTGSSQQFSIMNPYRVVLFIEYIG